MKDIKNITVYYDNNDSKSRKDKHYYISEGMVIAYGIVADYLGDLEVII